MNLHPVALSVPGITTDHDGTVHVFQRVPFGNTVGYLKLATVRETP